VKFDNFIFELVLIAIKLLILFESNNNNRIIIFIFNR